MSTAVLETRMDAKRICQDGYSISPDGERMSIDGMLIDRFGAFTEAWSAGYSAVQPAIVELDWRFIDRLPESVNVEEWNDSPDTDPEMILEAWILSMCRMGRE